MKILSVVGARPQFVKLAPIAKAMQEADMDHVIVHTGQHYDANMSDIFFHDLNMPRPDIHLGVGSGSHGGQTAAMLTGLERVIESQRPDWVLVYGDTNSTLAAALAAVKLHVKVAHLEAGLRSFNRRMPEEHNRVLTDHAADLLLAPTVVAQKHLANEGLDARTVVVGDVMVDICFRVRDGVMSRDEPPNSTPYIVATIHRPDNTDSPEVLSAIVQALAASPRAVRLVAHPRLRAAAERFGITLETGAIKVEPPLGYLDMVSAVMYAEHVVTDSGGLQKEAYLLGTPCTTLRAETEWVETLHGGWNILVDDVTTLGSALKRAAPAEGQLNPYGIGDAATRTVQALLAR